MPARYYIFSGRTIDRPHPEKKLYFTTEFPAAKCCIQWSQPTAAADKKRQGTEEATAYAATTNKMK